MKTKRRGPLGYIFSASLLPTCLLLACDELMKNSNNLKGLVLFCLFFLMLSVLWDIIGMISLIAEGAGGRLAIGISAILFQMGIYYLLWQTLGIKIGAISF